MKVILDTNALIWATDDGGQLSAKARHHLNNPATVKIVSVVVFWDRRGTPDIRIREFTVNGHFASHTRSGVLKLQRRLLR